MNLPKVAFQNLNVNENIESLVWCAMPQNSITSPLNLSDLTLELFPELKGKITQDITYEKLYPIIANNVKPTLENLFTNNADVKKYQQIWNKINNDIMLDLANILQIKWPNNFHVTCKVGLLPVSPRDIYNHTFIINHGITKDNLIAITIHELCHFLYFEKWKKLYPDYKTSEFDSPHLVWYLSEAMIDPLINNATFKKYTKADLSAYPIFYKTIINDKSVISILREYVNSYPIDEAIKKGYELFKEYEAIIKNI